MHIILLGTAAGGGFPQWNCSCIQCIEVRGNSGRSRSRTQSGVAISGDGERWFLLNASPDIRIQIESFGRLQPRSKATRGSPIEAVLLTNADLDHTLGLLLLREGARLSVHASQPVQEALTTDLPVTSVMDSFCGINWVNIAEDFAQLQCRDGTASGLRYSAFAVPGKTARFVKGKGDSSRSGSVGYKFLDEKTGGRLVFVPDIGRIERSLLPIMADCDVLLFDGTFWSEWEMRDCGAADISAHQMGHVPISGEDGSLSILATLPVKNRVYVHINNTNPILIEDSPQRAAVHAAGIKVGEDKMQFEV